MQYSKPTLDLRDWLDGESIDWIDVSEEIRFGNAREFAGAAPTEFDEGGSPIEHSDIKHLEKTRIDLDGHTIFASYGYILMEGDPEKRLQLEGRDDQLTIRVDPVPHDRSDGVWPIEPGSFEAGPRFASAPEAAQQISRYRAEARGGAIARMSIASKTVSRAAETVQKHRDPNAKQESATAPTLKTPFTRQIGR